jgi:ribosomal protein L16 Arg81 hydroxylase
LSALDLLTQAEQGNELLLIRNLLQSPSPAEIAESLGDEAVIPHRLAAGRLAVFHEGAMVFPDTREEFDRLHDLHQSFVALDLDQVSPLAANLQVMLRETFRRNVTIFGYASNAGHAAMTPHVDTHYVLWLQWKGIKEIGLGDDGNKVACSIKLHPGDCLFMPPGVFHATKAITDSRHFCVGLHERLDA